MKPEWAAGYSERDWVCLRKRRYETVEAAARAAEISSRFFSKLKLTTVDWYRCPFCRNWHLARKEINQ
jgi:hypothetical protein